MDTSDLADELVACNLLIMKIEKHYCVEMAYISVSMSASNAVGHGFAFRMGHTKDYYRNGTYCLPAWHTGVKSRNLAVQPDCVKGQVVYGTVNGDMHIKDLLGSIARVWYCFPVPDFYLVVHNLQCKKKL